MSNRYRIKLPEGRIIGPFMLDEVEKLRVAGKISGTEEAQIFPIGEWKKIQDIPEIFELFAEDEEDFTPVAEGPDGKPVGVQEFKFDRNAKVEINYEELEKKYQEQVEKAHKTKVLQKPKNLGGDEKTVVIKRDIPWAEEEISAEEVVEEKEKTQIKQVNTAPAVEEDISNEKTELIKLERVLPIINAELQHSEIEVEQQIKIEEQQDHKEVKELEDKKKELEKEKRKLVGMKPIVAIAFIALFYFLYFEDDEPVKIKGPQFIEASFPVTLENQNPILADDSFAAGMKEYQKEKYINKVAAIKYFHLSLQNKLRDNPALGMLILSYAELFENFKDKIRAKNTIYRLTVLGSPVLYRDQNVALGTSLFYAKNKKFLTALNILDNYVRLEKKISVKILTFQLNYLLEIGDYSRAKDVFDKLKTAPQKTPIAYLALNNYLKQDEKPQDAKAIIEEGFKLFPQDTELKLASCEYLFQDGNIKEVEKRLSEIDLAQAEYSPLLTAKLLEQEGMLQAYKQKTDKAIYYFKKSLEIRESDELRSKLAGLEVSGKNFEKEFIIENKIRNLMKLTQVELNNKNFDTAFIYALEAANADLPKPYLPAKLLLAKVMTKRGFFVSAIETLENIQKDYPENFSILEAVIQTYLDAYKLEDARRELFNSAQSKFSLSAEYASLMANFYLKKSNVVLASKWFLEATSRDPLRDEDYYKQGKMFMRMNKFEQAKKHIFEALKLDPKNENYVIAFAEILFESNPDSSIGYLLDYIEKNGESTKLLAEVAVLFHRSGQLKEFEKFKEKVEQLPQKDADFYRFLVEVAKREEKTEDEIKFSTELLKIEPGDLAVRNRMAELYFFAGNFDQSVEMLESIRERLPSYPKVNFNLAKIYISQGNLPKAQEAAEAEVRYNPTLDSSYFILGEVFKEKQNNPEAIKNLEKSISLNSKSVEALISLGRIKASQKYNDVAMQYFTRAKNLDENNPEVFKYMGYLFREMGQRALAREQFEQYLKLNPGASDAQTIQKVLNSL